MKTNIYHDLDSNTGLSFLSMMEIFQKVSVLQTFSFFALPLEVLQGKTFRKTGSSSSSLCERRENDVPALGLGSDTVQGRQSSKFLILHSFRMNSPQDPHLYSMYLIKSKRNVKFGESQMCGQKIGGM